MEPVEEEQVETEGTWVPLSTYLRGPESAKHTPQGNSRLGRAGMGDLLNTMYVPCPLGKFGISGPSLLGGGTHQDQRLSQADSGSPASHSG